MEWTQVSLHTIPSLLHQAVILIIHYTVAIGYHVAGKCKNILPFFLSYHLFPVLLLEVTCIKYLASSFYLYGSLAKGRYKEGTNVFYVAPT